MASRSGSTQAINISNCEHRGRNHNGEFWKKTWACYRCGSTNQDVRNFIIKLNDAPVQSHRSTPTSWDQGPTWGGAALGGGKRRGNDSVTSQLEARASTSTYTICTREEVDTTDVVSCIFFIFNIPVHTLIYPMSIHPYISTSLIVLGSFTAEKSKIEMNGSSPLG